MGSNYWLPRKEDLVPRDYQGEFRVPSDLARCHCVVRGKFGAKSHPRQCAFLRPFDKSSRTFSSLVCTKHAAKARGAEEWSKSC